MSEHTIEWSPTPKPVPVELAVAVEAVEHRLPQLSDDTNRVLRASSIAPGTFEALVARLNDDDRHALIRRMQ